MNFGYVKKEICALAMGVLLFHGCSDDDSPIITPGPQPVVNSMPAQFHMSGEARATAADGRTVTCALDLIFETRTETGRSNGQIQYQGVHGGDVQRRILRPNGSGFLFRADVYGDVETQLDTFTGAVQLRIPINETADGRFWRNMAAFNGTVDSAGNGNGSWTCAPLDIDQGGYVDKSIVAQGTWRISPIQ